MVVPIGKKEAGWKFDVTFTGASLLSYTKGGVQVTFCCLSSVRIRMFGGQGSMIGGVISIIIKGQIQLAWLPVKS